jgi:hypothetical protein
MLFNIFAEYLGQKLRYFAFFGSLWFFKQLQFLKSSLNIYTPSSPFRGRRGLFTRAWCNGSIRVSKTFDLGSNPSARANTRLIRLNGLTN